MLKKVQCSVIARTAIALILLAGVLVPVSASAGAAAEYVQREEDRSGTAQGISPQDLLNPDGTLKLDGTYSGSLDLQEWDVQLDPARGPVFTPDQASASGGWSAVGATGGEGAIPDEVWAIAVKGTDVYVGGFFMNAYTLPEADYIAKWDGTSWSALGSDGAGNGSLNAFVKSIVISGDDIYVGGVFTDVNNNGTVLTAADGIAKWDGTNWSALGSDGAGNGSLNGGVSAMAMSGGDLYVGGGFTDVNNHGAVLTAADYVAKWDGTNWSALGSDGAGNGSLNWVPRAIAVSGSDVYVGGEFTNVNNHGTVLTAADYIAEWDGTNWSALGSNGAGNGSLTNTVYAIAVNGNNVYAGGTFVDVNNKGTVLKAADYITRWDGTNWSSLGATYDGEGSLIASVLAIAVSGNNVYAGGYFFNIVDGSTFIGNADYIAKWDGTHWAGLGSNGAGGGSLNESVWSLFVTPTTLYAGGIFTDVNNNGTLLDDADHIAAYRFVVPPPATLTVTKLADTNDGVCDTDCSLREAIINANDGDTIKFGVSGTIMLGSTLPTVVKKLVVDGSGQVVTLDGGGSHRILNVMLAGNLTLKNLTLENGHPDVPCLMDVTSTCGGAIYNDGILLSIVNVTFSGNTADMGGAIYGRDGTTNIESSTFTGNSAAHLGGAYLNWAGDLNLLNSTLESNTAAWFGGAIYNDFGYVTLKNNTFSNNASPQGGAVYNSAGTLAFSNNLLANSTTGSDCYNESPYGEISLNVNNLIETNAASPNHCGTPFSTLDPKLGPLANNGGFTKTMALLTDSPAIDAGSNANCTAKDQRGITRPQGIRCDMGAYEFATTFADVPLTHPYYKDIEILYANGLTGGCATNPLKYCPDQIMNRGQAAVFVLRANFGSSYVPPVPTHIFKDDWSKGTWAEPWAEGMKLEGLSAGCLSNPLKYCPWDQIPREQAVIFTLRMKYGTLYTPPPATGTVFADMTNPGYYATAWAEQAYKDGIIQNCGMSGGKPKFCPKALVSRGLAAYMIVRAKNLTKP